MEIHAVPITMFGHPVLKFRTKDKLHISKEPGIISWGSVISLVLVNLVLDLYVIPDIMIARLACLSGFVLLGLNLMEKWEDFVMDKEENLVTFVNRSWYHGFSLRVPEENVVRFPLNSITAVVMNAVAGIDIMRNDGTSAILAPEVPSNSYLRHLRKEISTFLHLERVEELSESDRLFCDWSMDPWGYDGDSPDRRDSDTETQDSTATQESRYEYGRNIKIISGPSVS